MLTSDPQAATAPTVARDLSPRAYALASLVLDLETVADRFGGFGHFGITPGDPASPRPLTVVRVHPRTPLDHATASAVLWTLTDNPGADIGTGTLVVTPGTAAYGSRTLGQVHTNLHRPDLGDVTVYVVVADLTGYPDPAGGQS